MNEIIKELKKLLKNKSQAELAKELGISQPYLHDILKGRRGVDGLAAKMGFEKRTIYVKKS